MIGLSNGHRRITQDSIEGCMGKMINVFDLSAGMAGNKLLTEKAHRDGSPVRRNRSDTVKKPIDPVRGQIDERPITINDVRKSSPSKKSSATPMKMLIAQELLRETEAKRKQPSIVARLMGLDETLPVQQPVLTAKRNSNESYPRSKSAGAPRGRRQPGDAKLERSASHEIHSCSHEKEYKDVYAVFQQPSRTNHSRDYATQKERPTENQDTKRMALVRQKFMEAKRLATDEKLLHSKEFQDALEVLSSNRDLFLKFLEEPNSLFSKNAQELHSVSSPHQKKRITVLKPSNCVEPKGERRVAKPQYSPSIGNDRETNKSYRVSNSSYSKSDNLFQPTRIVVLKPSPTKYRDVKGTPTSTSSSPELPQITDFYRGHRRDESLLMNGYIGDDSSIDKSDNEYIEEDAGNFSDLEIMSSVSRNSWDYNNRMGSPYSPSSFDRMSYSPESSVIREARKRLSERWASVASKGNNEDTQVWKSSSTLGEMLAIPEVKKKAINNRGFAASSSRSYGGEDELMATAAFPPAGSGQWKDVGVGDSSPRTLSRSRSVPVSSSAYENVELDGPATRINNSSTLKGPATRISNSSTLKEAAKSKSGRTSFKGKVSSFFSRNKKSDKQKPAPPLNVGSGDRIQAGNLESVSKNRGNLTKSVGDSIREEILLMNYDEQSGKASSPVSGGSAFSSKVVISHDKPRTSPNMSKNQDKLEMSGNPSTNHDQPSPTSILDASFEDDVQSTLSPSSEIANAGHSQAISRSAPIESITHSLSWDDTQFEIPSSTTIWKEEEEEHAWFMYFQSLLSVFGLDTVRVDTVFARWHSPESPLDPLAVYTIIDPKEEGAKSRERRSSQRLLFDCVNIALLEVGHRALVDAYPWVGKAQRQGRDGALVAKEVWGLVKGWLSSQEVEVAFDAYESSLVADRLLRKDVAGGAWAGETTLTEVDEICREIEGEVLEELISEALLEIC